jgi:hypothetical protein
MATAEWGSKPVVTNQADLAQSADTDQSITDNKGWFYGRRLNG